MYGTTRRTLGPILLGLALVGCDRPAPLDLTSPGLASGDRLVGVANRDDDDDDGREDFRRPHGDDGDWLDVTLPPELLRRVRGRHTLELQLQVGEDVARLWYGGDVVADHTADRWWAPVDEAGDDGLTFQVELGEVGATGQLVVRHLDADDEPLAERTYTLVTSPMRLNHHLRPVEALWLMDVFGGGLYNNQQMVSAYMEVFGDQVSFVDQLQHGFDVWVQDEMQLGTLTGPGDQRLDFVLDSIRDGGLDPLPKSLFGEGKMRQTHGQPDFANTYDSFGNLEVTPPVTVDGVAYPHGRIYYGADPGFEPDPDMVAFLEAQRLQEPLALDTSWLCVGHVDEYMTFLPDPSSDKGFRLAFADIDLAWEILEDMDPSTALPRYAREEVDLGHDRPDVASLVDDPALRALNDDLDRLYLGPIRDKVLAEFGLTDDDVIGIPTLFEEAPFCFGGVAALTPGMVNLVVAEVQGDTHLMIADPFLRDGDDVTSQADDPFIAYMREALPPELELHFVDDWYVYHMGLGEVHCATNERRTPAGPWWDDATHLLPEDAR